MRVSKLGNLVVAALVGLPLTLVVACSDDPVVTPAAKPVQACPGQLVQASGAACFDSNVTCDYPLNCPNNYDQQVRCPCDGSKFNCTYRGDVVAKAAIPECKPSLGTNGDACPASVTASEGKACNSTGQLCTFLGPKCADGEQKTDTCVCGATEKGFVYSCSRKLCPGDGGVIPVPDASGDAAEGG